MTFCFFYFYLFNYFLITFLLQLCMCLANQIKIDEQPINKESGQLGKIRSGVDFFHSVPFCPFPTAGRVN